MSVSAQTVITSERLFAAWPQFREPALTQRRFSAEKLQELLLAYADDKQFTLREAGRSVEGRPISLLTYGQGPVKVLLWSQMHGDEPTATAALLDIFRFLQRDEPKFRALRSLLSQELTLCFLPMLNPDGAARFQRRNALEIDLNRDALALQSPESQLLKQLRDSLQADWGFNLHDQNRGYAAGPEGAPASITLLAPPLDAKNTLNPRLSDAMQLVVRLYDELQAFLPDGVGRWSDEFEPRAFGENMQRWGTRTVLIESGGKAGDPERQEVRRLNFVAILLALQDIATQSYRQANIDRYQQIPLNEKRWLDLLIRNVQADHAGYTYQTDLGILREESETGGGRFYVEGEISEWGDLRTFFGYDTLDAAGLQLAEARIYPRPFANLQALSADKADEILRQGYTGVVVSSLPDSLSHSPYRINLHRHPPKLSYPAFEAPADFLLLKGKQPIIAVVNGFAYALQEESLTSGQGRVEREE